ncbi:diguanylate cyclase (GGDEF) domain-containing protein [Paraburkholderia tuberum]|uniref:diguanylate cyclase n=1 Tax=Paraburkholderia tuberum TaxID=157910 RepID=A0A1H1JEY1_9BURK|nr:diguanylate cyclase (GGDEF) domain-containing protein [Paraburkholderia tuberum]
MRAATRYWSRWLIASRPWRCARPIWSRATAAKSSRWCLPDTTAQGAFAVAEQIRRKVENQVIVREHDAPQAVTVSVGCATALPSATDVAKGLELMAAADGQLYVAKNEGRNRTRSAQWDEDSATQGVSRTGRRLNARCSFA